MLSIPRLLCSVAVATAATLGASAQTPTSLTGNWSGSIAATDFVFHITEPASGPKTATLDIPAQGAQGLPLQFATTSDSVYLRLPQLNAQFAGRRGSNPQQLTGEWQQNGQRFPVTLTRTTGGVAAAPRRPQTPKAPFPYLSTDITFPNAQAGIKLAGTFTVPQGKGPFPAVVLLTGSGPEDRNSTIYGHQPFAVLADYLTRRGIAVLRFDDRGVGKSEGSLATASAADYATDAAAAMAWLRAQPNIDKKHVGLAGHSEGGTAAILAAGQKAGPDFLVLLAAPGLPGDEMIVQQVLAMNRLKTQDAATLAAIEKQQRQLLSIIQQNPDNEKAHVLLRDLLNPTHSTDPQVVAAVNRSLAQLTSPEYRHILADQPSKTLPLVHCPVLALGGSKDIQVVATSHLAAIEQGLKAGGNRDVTVRELPGLNHLFQTATTGGVAEYATIEETFSPTALQIISDWVTQHTRK
jgi:pimeloyl-ACP methyl ester carboxylesterase